MAKPRKRVRMIVEVSVPQEMPAWEARREVRTLINHQTSFSSRWGEGDVKARIVSPIPEES